MDGPRDSGPGQIWICRTCPEKIAIKEHGHIRTWDDDPRGTFSLTPPVASVVELVFPFAGGNGQESLRAYKRR